ncbi:MULTISPECIES: hypothetical protein [Streptomyces]|uniref:hypothetical protein n=1 Tax=Streptomyces TaxID=1883 RepID=UPI0013D96D39|nr:MULTISPECIES: hypothetical protein [Streptomyces]MCX4420312.1 hypothetical protein [Streptomyces mirabilis]
MPRDTDGVGADGPVRADLDDRSAQGAKPVPLARRDNIPLAEQLYHDCAGDAED